jgi:uncharacterized protein (DUF1778 family)
MASCPTKSGMDEVKTTIRLSADLYRKIKEAAALSQVSMADFIRLALVEAARKARTKHGT